MATSENSPTQEPPVSKEELTILNQRQKMVYSKKLSQFAEYLYQKGKDPKKNEGYAEKSVSVRTSRLHQMVKWVWSNEEITTNFSAAHGDAVNKGLFEDDLCRNDGEPYAEGTKRKFNDTLRTWFEFRGISWEPEYSFTDERPTERPDPFSRSELRTLSEGTLTYKTIPSYNNLTPDERDRWKAHLAQELGKPKSNVSPDDWKEVNTCWKVPSLIRTAREAGWQPDLLERLSVEWYIPEDKRFHIPAGEAVKNDLEWNVYLSDESAFYLEKWLEQRKNMEMYDDCELVWLTRKQNQYTSGTLNDLLRKLMDHVGINQQGRKLVWYSFRHSIGTYVTHEKSKVVAAEQLRHSPEATDYYIHPLPEEQKEASKIM